jgi:O-antigen/teichoic acid export membrane protein
MTSTRHGSASGDVRMRPAQVSEPPPSRRGAISGLLRNQDLLRNAGSLVATTGLTSVFGFVYWIYAARVFPQAAVGLGSAAISTMTLLGTIGMFGLGTMLIGELPRRESRGGLIMAALIASFLGSLVLGLGFAVVSLAFGSHFVEIGGTFGRMLVFSFGVAITGAMSVFDEATIGLMRGGLQLTRNVAVSIAKMAALPACALVLHDVFGVGIMLSWVLGTVASVLPVIVLVKRSGTAILYRPDWATFRRLGKVTLSHNWFNLAITTPSKLIPVLAVIVVTPSANAAYYIASMLASFLFMVPLHLSTVLFAVASAEPEAMPEKLRFVLRMSLAIGVPGGLVLGASSHFVLGIFGSDYASVAAGPLWLLLASYLPGLPNTVYIAVCRASGRVNQATLFVSVSAVIEMAAVVVGGKLGGLYGLSYAMLTVAILEALVTTPVVLRAAYGSAPVRSAAAPATGGQRRLRPHSRTDAIRVRQEAGLAALVALATSVSPDRYDYTGGFPSVASTSGFPSVATTTRAWMARTGSMPSADRGSGRRRPAPVAPTTLNPVLADAPLGPDVDEAAFQARQEAGIAALIAIATPTPHGSSAVPFEQG